MNEFNVGSYSNMENAVTATNAYSAQVDNTKEIAKKATSQLLDEKIFNGPVQNECIELLSKVNESMQVLSDNFKKLSCYLAQVTNNYREADSKVSNSISNI